MRNHCYKRTCTRTLGLKARANRIELACPLKLGDALADGFRGSDQLGQRFAGARDYIRDLFSVPLEVERE